MSSTRFEAVTDLVGLPLNGPQRLDSYMVWDRLTDNARHLDADPERRQQQDHRPVMVEFRSTDPGVALAAWCATIGDESLRDLLAERFAPSIGLGSESRIHTATLPCSDGRVESALLAAVTDGVLERFVLGAPCAYVGPPSRRAPPAPTAKPGERGWRYTLGIIDDGCSFAHQSFRDEHGCRVFALWDQSPSARATQPWRPLCQSGATVPYSYGVEMLQSDMTALLDAHPAGEAGERALYASIGRGRWGPPDHAHGAKVMQLLAGPVPGDPARGLRKAVKMPIVFVQLPEQTLRDVTGDSLGMYVVDGARYIAERARALAASSKTWSTTINISLGSVCGPHDGTSMAERALVDLMADGLVMVVTAAGNAGGETARTHAKRTIKAGQPGRFVVRAPPDNPRDGFIELWFDTRSVEIDSFSLQVVPPGGDAAAAPRWRVGNAAVLGAAGAMPHAALVFARRVAQGLNDTMALLTIAPTVQRPGDAGRSLAPAGHWVIEVCSDSEMATDVHAWIERDDEVVGVRRGQQMCFERIASEAADGDDDEMTLGSLANAPQLVAVGAVVESSSAAAPYSGNGPLRRNAGGPNTVPSMFAVADRSQWVRGIPVAGFYSGTRTTMRGTSAAAPQAARQLAEARRDAAIVPVGSGRPPHPSLDRRVKALPAGARVLPRQKREVGR